MLTLDEMIERGGGIVSRSEWVKHKDFSGMYVRVGRKYIAGEVHEHVIDLANIQAKKTGKGAFKKLIVYLREHWSEHDIHVENVLTERFRDGLKRMGFIDTGTPHCYWLPRSRQLTNMAKEERPRSSSGLVRTRLSTRSIY